MDINLEPIDYVENDVREPGERDYYTVISEIIVNKELAEALDSIENFSHIIIIYWMSLTSLQSRSILKVHPRGKKEFPLVGVFATRSPAHKNPIGISTVKLLEHHENTLKVMGLDAINGTPVLDIKPYIPDFDLNSGAKIAPWIVKM